MKWNKHLQKSFTFNGCCSREKIEMQSNTHLHFMLHRLLIKSNQNGRKGNKTRREEMLIKWRLLLFCPFLISLFYLSFYHFFLLSLSHYYSFSAICLDAPLCKFLCSWGSAEADRKKCIEHTFVAIWEWTYSRIAEKHRTANTQIADLWLSFACYKLETSTDSDPGKWHLLAFFLISGD